MPKSNKLNLSNLDLSFKGAIALLAVASLSALAYLISNKEKFDMEDFND